MTCKHLLNGAPDCVFCHRDQLRRELSLAEEGLANATQEIEQLKAENARLIGRCAALAFLHYGGPSPDVEPPPQPGEQTAAGPESV